MEKELSPVSESPSPHFRGIRHLPHFVLWEGIHLPNWSISAELFSLILVIILILSFQNRRRANYPTSRLYQTCLWGSAGTILINLLCVLTIQHAAVLPLWINLLLNSAYFLSITALATLTAHYLFHLLLEHTYNHQAMHKAQSALLALYAGYTIAIILNLRSGIIFYFDKNDHYCRGPLVNLGYGIMGIELLLVLLCALRNRASISIPMRRVIQILPPTVLLLTVYQLVFPEILMNGCIIVVSDLILLLNFQSRRIETDSLTCINNRSSFYQEVQLRLASRQQFQVIALSLRRFSDINQHYGHENGDALLFKIATWLNRLHPQGKAFRLGNVEFALLLPYKHEAEASHTLNTVRERFQRGWDLGFSQVVIQASFAELIHLQQEWAATDIPEFLRFSLQQAAGRESGLVSFDQFVFSQIEQRREILQRMRRALESNAFQVWYQPLYHCKTQTFSSAEALLRLRDEQGDLIPPSLFVSIAEESGLLDEISWVLLDRVCALLGSGQVPQLQSISINLSMQQFMSDHLVDRIAQYLELYHVPPKRLKVEVTERVISEDVGRVGELMTALTRMGVQFYLDDFGTGYSNLSTVLDLPFSCVKLDHSLIDNFPDQDRSASIVSSMMALFHGMGFTVVAEGVENARQAEALMDSGADWLQGYHFARPMPRAELIRFLSSGETASPEPSPAQGASLPNKEYGK